MLGAIKVNILHLTLSNNLTSCLDNLLFQSEGKLKLFSKLSWAFYVISTKNLVKIGSLKRTVNVQMESCPKNVVRNCRMIAGGKLPLSDRTRTNGILALKQYGPGPRACFIKGIRMFLYLTCKLMRKTFLLKNLVFHKTGVNIKMFLNVRVLQTTLVNAYIDFSVDKSIKKTNYISIIISIELNRLTIIVII